MKEEERKRYKNTKMAISCLYEHVCVREGKENGHMRREIEWEGERGRTRERERGRGKRLKERET